MGRKSIYLKWTILFCVLHVVSLDDNTVELIPDTNNTDTLPPSKPYPHFSQVGHEVHSGRVTFLTPDTLLIEDLFYDGLAPDAHFLVGSGDEPNSVTGFVIPDEDGEVTHPLHAYHGVNVTLTIPENSTRVVEELDWLAVWCVASEENFGHVMLGNVVKEEGVIGEDEVDLGSEYVREDELVPDEVPEEEEEGSDRKSVTVSLVQRTTDGYLKHIELSPFPEYIINEIKTITSGPILLIDDETIFISNFFYDNSNCTETYFRTISKTNNNSITIPDENGSVKPIESYEGIDIELSLSKLTELSAFEIWCKSTHETLTRVNFHGIDLSNLPRKNEIMQQNGPRLIYIQKCCGINQILDLTGCLDSNITLKLEINVLEGNKTHVNSDENLNVQFVPYFYNVDCKHGKYPIFPSESEYELTTTGYLLMPDRSDLVKKDEYCFDTVSTDNPQDPDETIYVTTVLLCFQNEEDTPEFIYKAYYICVFVSSGFLLLTCATFVFLSVRKPESFKCTRVLSIICYTATMACGFIILATTQYLRPDGISCNILGYVFQLLLISSFTWLTILTREIFYRIEHAKIKCVRRPRRFRKYVGFSVGIPFVCFLLSLAIEYFFVNSQATSVKLGIGTCWFRSYGIMYYYYSPILFAIAVSLYYWRRTETILGKMRKEGVINNVDQNRFRQMCRSNFIILLLMAICWLMEVFTYWIGVSPATMVITILEALQGVFVFLLYVTQNPVRNVIFEEIRLICTSCFCKSSTVNRNGYGRTKTEENEIELAYR